MSTTPTPTQTQAERDEEEALHYRAMARRLADMAMQMAEQVLQDSRTISEPGTDHTARFERASRTVRRAILLARKLAEPLRPPRQPPRPAAANPPDQTATCKRIIRVVEDAIDRRHRTHGIDVEPLEAELLDRLDRPDLEADLATRPIDEIIADLARDLGCGSPLNETFHVWKRRTPEDIQNLEAHAAGVAWVLRPTNTGSSGSTGHHPGPLPPIPRSPGHQLPDDGPDASLVATGQIRDG